MSNLVNLELSPHEAFVEEPDRFLNLIDSIPALVAYIDCNMVLQYCNQPFKNWFTLEGEAANKAFQLVVGKQVFDQLQRYLGKVLTGERAHFQISVTTMKGLQYLDATLSPDFDRRRNVKGFIFHCSDITEKNRTERALKDYFENASIGLHWVDENGIVIWANPAELKMLGYAESEYIGHHISKFHANKDVIEDILNRLRNKQSLSNYDAQLVCKDGSIKQVSINSTVLWEGDKFIHTRCFTIDVTEQHRAAKAVMESEERFRTMANLVPLTIWTTDEKGDCNFLSVKWKEITGTDVEEGLKTGWYNFVHPEDRTNIVHSWMSSFSTRRPFEGKFRFLNADRKYIISYASATPRYSVLGEFAGYIGILQDISSQELIKSSLEKIVLERTEDLRKRNADLKLAEKALKDKNRELEEINNQLSAFAHVASHDLQEPLRKIQTFSSLLYEVEGNKYSEKGKDLYQRIQKSSDRMRTLIHDLLTYSKSSGADGNFDRVDLDVLFLDVVNELEVKIQEKNAIIENLGLPEVCVIRFQFQQLFLNLMSNALKFSKPNTIPHIVFKSEVSVIREGQTDKSYYHLSIKDNGIGFEPQYSERIFEMFQRLHGRTQYEGTGIGLAICKKIVENHKGMISAESQVDEGTTFHIYIPM
jgi:PAS domain S-box-containing protein